MSAPYARLRDIISRAESGDLPPVDGKGDRYLDQRGLADARDDIQPWSTPTRIVEELIESFDPLRPRNCARVYVDATMEEMKTRRRSMNAILQRTTGRSLSISVVRLDPRAKGGTRRMSPWEITIVQNMETAA